MTTKRTSDHNFYWPVATSLGEGQNNSQPDNGTIVIIDSDIVLSQDTYLAANTTLIFQGGIIAGSSQNIPYKFKGNMTAIQAPACQILEKV